MNAVTRALLRRDRPLWLFFGLAGTVALAATLIVESFVHIWVLPPMSVESLFHGAWICGATLGLVAGCYDTLLRTSDYAVHRPVSPRRQHRTRLLGCVLVIFLWLLLVPLAHLASEWLFGRAAHAFSPSNLPFVWLNMLPAFSACAIGYFAGTLPIALWWRLPAGGALLFGAFVIADAVRRSSDDTNAPFALAHITIAVLFASASSWHAGTSHDPDLPWPARVRRRSVALLTIAFAVSVSLLLGMQRKNFLHDLRWTWPRIAALPSGMQLVVQEQEGDSYHWYRCDAEHRPGERILPGWSEAGFTYPSLPRDPEIDRPRSAGAEQRIWGWGLAAVLRDGTLHFTYLGPQRQFRTRQLIRPDGAPFSPDTRLHERHRGSASGSLVWVLEPGSTKVLTLSLDGTVGELPLPDGDRIVGTRHVRRQTDAIEPEPGNPLWSNRQSGTVLVGEQHVYSLETDNETRDDNAALSPERLQRAPQWADAAARQDAPPRRRHSELVDADPAAPLVRIVDAQGTVLFEHRFAPRRAAERWSAALLFATSAVAMPALQVLSFATAAPTSSASPFMDFVLRDQRRLWLLALCIAIATASALLHRRHLLRRGAAPATARLWCVLGVLCGPCTWLVAMLGDGARAYRRPADTGTPAARPRIATLLSA